MCGFVGVASIFQNKNSSWVSRGSSAIKHRGPDDCGYWHSGDKKVFFSHRRLSILDLSNYAKQPMESYSGNVVIVFNGEIYNHNQLRGKLRKKGVIFKSNSDTEVILESYIEWGNEFLSLLNGMFSFVIYDKRKQIVLMARDISGEKPIFYKLTEGEIRFSSELKGLLVDDKQPIIDRKSIENYLSVGYVSGGDTILDTYSKLQPAHAMIFNLYSGKSVVWKYWDLPDIGCCNTESVHDKEILLHDLENIIEDSVSLQLEADVPVGVLLSGGLDSSLITAIASRHTDNLNTFTVCFPGNNKLDESKHARLISRYFRSNHIELNANDFPVESLQLLAKQFDEPIADSSMIPTFLLSKLVSKYCKVLLGGDGGDELFGGYSHYSRLLHYQNATKLLPYRIRKLISLYFQNILPLGFKGRSKIIDLGMDFSGESLPIRATYFDRNSISELLSNYDQHKSTLDERDSLSCFSNKNNDLLQIITRMDFYNYLPNDILTKVDRASMINSVEFRSPFLDKRLVEYAFGKIPSELKATRYNKKIILKELAEKILPSGFEYNRKQGFSAPLGEWMKEDSYNNFFKEVLLDPGSIFNTSKSESLFKSMKFGGSNSERIFSLVIFELWAKEYNARLR